MIHDFQHRKSIQKQGIKDNNYSYEDWVNERTHLAETDTLLGGEESNPGDIKT